MPAANSIVPISRFVSPTIFATKTRGYGCLFELAGADEEGLTDSELNAKVRAVETGLRGLPEGSSLYQYMRVTSGFEIPRQDKYADPITQFFVDHRLDFLARTANFRRIDLHWCLTFEPELSNPFAAKPKDQENENERLITQLQKAATILETHLSGAIGLRLVSKEKAFQFFCELFNLEEWASHTRLVSDLGVDQQIVNSAVSWEHDHLRVGRRHVQMFSLTSTPAASQPCLFNGIANLTCDSVLCTTWRPQSTSTVRKEISAQEKWIDFFKVGIFQRVMAGKNFAALDQGAGAKAASEGVDDLGIVVRELNKKGQGKYTVTLLLSAKSAEELRENTPVVHRTFVDAQVTVIEETIGNLSAFLCDVPLQSAVQRLSTLAWRRSPRPSFADLCPEHWSSHVRRPRQRIPECLRDPAGNPILSGRLRQRGAGSTHHRTSRDRKIGAHQPDARIGAQVQRLYLHLRHRQ